MYLAGEWEAYREVRSADHWPEQIPGHQAGRRQPLHRVPPGGGDQLGPSQGGQVSAF